MSSLGMRAESLKEEIQTMPVTHRFTIIAKLACLIKDGNDYTFDGKF